MDEITRQKYLSDCNAVQDPLDKDSMLVDTTALSEDMLRAVIILMHSAGFMYESNINEFNDDFNIIRFKRNYHIK